MGQYWKITNLDKKEVLHPHKFDDGLKLLEFGASGSGTMLGLAILLATSNNRGGGDLHSENPIIGSWAADRIAIIGDYWEDGDKGARADYEGVWGDNATYKDISIAVIKALCDDDYIRAEMLEGIAGRLRWDTENIKDYYEIFTPEEIKQEQAKQDAEREKRSKE